MANSYLNKESPVEPLLTDYRLESAKDLLPHDLTIKTQVEHAEINGKRVPQFINEFWTSKQRQVSSLHEISYRACFKAQLPRFFIKLLSEEGS